MSVYAKLCQSTMNLAPLSHAVRRHTVNAGTHGGVCSKMTSGLASRHIMSTVSCAICMSTRANIASDRGRQRCSHVGGGATSLSEMFGWCSTSPLGADPSYATTST